MTNKKSKKMDRNRKCKQNYKEEMIELHIAGATLQQIGDLFGITRERVRQIISKDSRYTVNRSYYCLTEDFKEKLREKKKEGKAFDDLCDKLCMNRAYTENIIRDSKIKYKKRGTIEYDPDKFNEFKKMWYDLSISIKEIAEKFNRSERNVGRIAKRLGLDNRINIKAKEFLKDEANVELLKKYWNEGKSIRQIAILLGINWTTVNRRAKRLGLERKNK